MKLSPQGLHLVAGFEGFVPTPYNDPAGNATVGYGHLLHLGPVTAEDRAKWGRLSVSEGLALLEADTAYYAAAVSKDVRVRLGVIPSHAQARFDALCSLAYNIGVAGFWSSSLIREINRKPAPRSWLSCGPLWLEWDHAGGKVLPGLLARRRLEFAIFDAGAYPGV